MQIWMNLVLAVQLITAAVMIGLVLMQHLRPQAPPRSATLDQHEHPRYETYKGSSGHPSTWLRTGLGAALRWPEPAARHFDRELVIFGCLRRLPGPGPAAAAGPGKLRSRPDYPTQASASVRTGPPGRLVTRTRGHANAARQNARSLTRRRAML